MAEPATACRLAAAPSELEEIAGDCWPSTEERCRWSDVGTEVSTAAARVLVCAPVNEEEERSKSRRALCPHLVPCNIYGLDP